MFKINSKLITLLAATGLSLNAVAQQPLNGGMENWLEKTANGTTFEEPANWYSLNILALVGFPQTNVRTGDAHSGQYAVLLETKSGSMSSIPGLLTSNNILTEQWEPVMDRNLIPFSFRPLSVRFFFKAQPFAGDTNAMYILLTRWNSTTQQRDTVGYGSWENYQTINQYTAADVPINYYGTYAPDSMAMLFSSSINGFDPVVGSKLYIDDISFNYAPASVKNMNAQQVVKLYPNPATENFNLYSEKEVCSLMLYNVKGEQVKCETVHSGENLVDCSALQAGLYVVVLYHSDNTVSQHRIVIKK